MKWRTRFLRCAMAVLLTVALVLGCGAPGAEENSVAASNKVEDEKDVVGVMPQKQISKSDSGENMGVETVEEAEEPEGEKSTGEKDKTVSTTKSDMADKAQTVSVDKPESGNKKTVTKDTDNSKTKKPDKSSSNNNTGTNNKPSSKPSQPSKPSKPEHQHSWEVNYKTVHHDAQYEERWVQDSVAWDEYVPIYETVYKNVCNQCGEDITGCESAHNKAHALEGGNGGWHSEWVQVQTGTEKIHHEATGHYEKIQTQKAYDEKEQDGYVCSGCGAKK
ncbi:hypothetical protein ABXS75_11005 [Roseburia hominis]